MRRGTRAIIGRSGWSGNGVQARAYASLLAPSSQVMLAREPSDKAGGARRFGSFRGVVAMGQAAVDLPDPLETPPPPQAGAPERAAAAGADELLAQMAGQEIDRLLADADVEPESATAVLTPAAVARDLETNTPDVPATPIPSNRTDHVPAAPSAEAA